jgi:hypothetical protein
MLSNPRPEALTKVVPHLTRLDIKRLYSIWCELLPLLARRKRQDLTEDLRTLVPIVESLDGKNALIETAQALTEINRWFP